MKSIALIAAAALIATPALANKGRSAASTPEATAAAPDAAPAKDKSQEKTCRTYQASGTHMKPERLCLTKEEWRKFDDNQ
jgi:hypothetical protein